MRHLAGITLRKILIASWLCLGVRLVPPLSYAASDPAQLMDTKAPLYRISLVAYRTPGLHQKNRQGVYDQLILQIIDNSTIPVDYQILPSRQAGYLMRKHRGAPMCEVPSQIRNWTEDGFNQRELTQSDSFNQAKLHAFTLSSEPKISAYKELKEPLGAVLGFGIPKNLKHWLNTKKISLIEIKSTEQLDEMLRSKRLAIGIAYLPDMNTFLKQENSPIHYDPEFVLMAAQDRIVCWKHELTLEWLLQVNYTLKKLRDSGKLEAMLGIYDMN